MTEAALILTHRLLSEGMADGLYVALPTMATANAMYKRLGEVYRRFYESNGDLPSLILAHGARELSDGFRKTVYHPENQAKDLNYKNGGYEGEQELSATAYCHAWLADSRKKNVLSTTHYLYTPTLGMVASLTSAYLFRPNRRSH